MKEEVVINLDLQQDEGDFAKLAQLKAAMIGIKQEQATLNEAFKKERITRHELANETVRLEANQKKLNASYTEIQRKVTGLKSPFANLSEQIRQQSQQINVAGISLSTFANPVTATIGLLGGLTKVYASSTNGAKDLEFASNQLSASFNLLGNNLANLVGSAEDGEGMFTGLLNSWLNAIGARGLAAVTKNLAMMKEQLEDLGRERLVVQAENNQRLQENIEIMEKLADSQVDFNEKQRLGVKAVTNLTINRDNLLKIAQQELEILEKQLATDSANEKLDTAVKLKKLEISEIQRNTEKQISRIDKTESNILDTQTKQTEQLEKQARLRKEKEEEEARKTDRKIRGKFDTDADKQTDAALGTLSEDWLTHNQTIRDADAASHKKMWDKRVRDSEDATKKQKEQQEKLADRTVQLYASQVAVYQQLLQTSNNAGEALFKGFLINMLRMLKSALEAKVIGESLSTLDSILTFGAAGAIRAAITIGLIEAAFGVAENAIMGFADSGRVEPGMGRPIRRKNGDNRVITAKVGEVILNEDHQRKLGGDATFAKIGVPGFSRSNVGQTGFAISGRVPMPDDSNRMLMRSFERLKIAVVIEQIEELQASRAQIREQATL